MHILIKPIELRQQVLIFLIFPYLSFDMPRVTLLLVILLFMTPLWGNGQGLSFKSSDAELIDNRTSYEVFAHNRPTLGSKFSIAFELSVTNPLSLGYVLTLKDQNSSVSYSLTYTNHNAQDYELKLNLEGEKNLLTVPLKEEVLGGRKWVKITLGFDGNRREIRLDVNDESYQSSEYRFDKSLVPELYFGKHGSIIDVPAMAIRNLKIQDQQRLFDFEFNENSGEGVHSKEGRLYGNVKNPQWLINESYHWKHRFSFRSDLVTAVTYDENSQRFIFMNKDSLVSYFFQKGDTTFGKYKNELPVPLRLGNAYLDVNSKRLFAYEINDVVPNRATIAELDLEDLLWTAKSEKQLDQQLHHHNLFRNPETNDLLIFGGFGNQRLTNNFHFYKMKEDNWDVLEFEGDEMAPRFFSGMATINHNELLIFGGAGNKSGDQSIGKSYFYDCYRVNLEQKTVKKLWDISPGERKMVAARNMVVNESEDAFYALCYPEYIPESFIQLYRYSIGNGDFLILGDSIPIISERIRTNANLYFNKATEEFFCVVQEFQLDGSNKTDIYSLSSPPVSAEFIYENSSSSNRAVLLVLGGIVPLIFLVFFYIYRKRRKDSTSTLESEMHLIKQFSNIKSNLAKSKNAVYLFGEFQVLNNLGKDITYLFSPKLKDLFLLILMDSYPSGLSTGISSEKINQVLWSDKSPQKAKNLRNVSLNQLRKIVEDIDGVKIVYSNGHYLLEKGDDFYCDYFSFRESMTLLKTAPSDEDVLRKLIASVHDSTFLQEMDDEFYDPYKKNLEQDIFEIIPSLIKDRYISRKFGFVIPLSDIIFTVDPINEMAFYYQLNALIKLKSMDKAKALYNNYINRHKVLLDEDFARTFDEVSKGIPAELI